MAEIKFSNQAIKDFEKIKQFPALEEKVIALLTLISENSFAYPPSYEKLLGFENVYSRRINRQHRLIYEVREKENLIAVFRMWGHYEWWKGVRYSPFSFYKAIVKIFF